MTWSAVSRARPAGLTSAPNSGSRLESRKSALLVEVERKIGGCLGIDGVRYGHFSSQV
jgi:hypothetical protein